MKKASMYIPMLLGPALFFNLSFASDQEPPFNVADAISSNDYIASVNPYFDGSRFVIDIYHPDISRHHPHHPGPPPVDPPSPPLGAPDGDHHGHHDCFWPHWRIGELDGSHHHGHGFPPPPPPPEGPTPPPGNDGDGQPRHHRFHGPHYVELDIVPILFLDIFRNTQIYSIDAHQVENYVLDKDQYSKVGDDITVLQKSSDDGAYRVRQVSQVAFGAGAGAGFHVTNIGGWSGLSPFAGLLPVFGKEAVSERTVSSKKELSELKKLTVPRSMTDFDAWNTGDKLTYSTNGGIMFMVGVTYYGLNVGVNYLANGIWTTSIAKIDSNRVYVKHSKRVLNNFGVIASAIVANINASMFRDVDKNFSYAFDISTDKGRQGLEQMLVGNLVAVKELSDDSKKGYQSEVVAIDAQVAKTIGFMRGSVLGGPFMSLKATDGNLFSHHMTQYYPDKTLIDAEYGIHMDAKNARFFNRARDITETFYGVDYKISSEENEGKSQDLDNGRYGVYAYSYTKNLASRKDFNNAVFNLVRKTGLSELKAQIPDDLLSVGSLNIQFELKFNEESTKALMDVASDTQKSLGMAKIGSSFVNSYFAKGDVNKICPNMIFSACVTHMRLETNHAVKQMIRSLRQMKQFENVDRKAFVKAYARFGEAMMVNQFAFQTGLNLVKGDGISANYKIEGGAFNNYNVSLKWLPQELD